jgi:TatA/E family protein of Tat protein translocase
MSSRGNEFGERGADTVGEGVQVDANRGRLRIDLGLFGIATYSCGAATACTGQSILYLWEICAEIVILVIVLLVFGPDKLPAVGKAFGDSMREFKHAVNSEGTDKPLAAADPTVRTTSGAPPTHICRSCQSAVPPGDRFCGHCGASLAAELSQPAV